MSEQSEVVRPLLDALHARAIYARRVMSGRVKVRGGWVHGAPAGTPDIYGFFGDGRGFVVECKKSHGDACKCPSCTAQRSTRRDLEQRKVLYVFARSVPEALASLGLA